MLSFVCSSLFVVVGFQEQSRFYSKMPQETSSVIYLAYLRYFSFSKDVAINVGGSGGCSGVGASLRVVAYYGSRESVDFNAVLQGNPDQLWA